ncbi:CAMK/CAMKL/PASK protein kinase [Polytolypa hystricis UAMH7299]|uniref:non-specific serine/threonine protein kinase n=1 Tax=Polytolypa hystricis (strain UAMH7299) TaxID=1447883 RepID=A0A2B7XSI4_POLH7|nr:CAMK/CAMKL/PASK protein kinase [Polytolypa hystricis UAMH7299]
MHSGQKSSSSQFAPRSTSPEPIRPSDIQPQGRLSVATSDDMSNSLKRLSVDAGSSEYDYMSRSVSKLSPLLEHEHGLGPSGLQRIRQQPQTRVNSVPAILNRSPIPPSQGASTTSSRAPSLRRGVSSPSFEDLHRFPSESLHSFSFAQQSEDLLHNRHNILKRSIDFMRDRIGFAASNAGLASAQARLSGDAEIQGMVDLVNKANLLERTVSHNQHTGFAQGPLTGPPDVDGDNIFDKAFTDASSLPHPAPDQSSVNGVRNNEPAEARRMLSPIPDDRVASPRRALKSAPASRRVSLKRTYTDTGTVELQNKLSDALAQPYSATDMYPPIGASAFGALGATTAVHTHSSKGAPVAQAVFRTDAKPNWTIIAANDLACLVFGITLAEMRKLSILDLVQPERRQWLESKLREGSVFDSEKSSQVSQLKSKISPLSPRSLGMGNGVTAQLLSKPPSRQRIPRKSQTADGSGSSYRQTKQGKSPNHAPTKSRGVLLCGDVVPIQKRNGATGAASFWVMEKMGGLIWVVEEIVENAVRLWFNDDGILTNAEGDVKTIWGKKAINPGISVKDLLPNAPEEGAENSKDDNFTKIAALKHFTAPASNNINIPITITELSSPRDLRISHFPHVAGMISLSPETLNIISANSVFSGALFGQEHPAGSHITRMIPDFDTYLNILTEEDNLPLVDGMVIPEHSFRRARALMVLREDRHNAASLFLKPGGLPARHRDGAEITVDIQMRIVKSETFFPDHHGSETSEGKGTEDAETESTVAVTEMVYALWITYSYQFHSVMPDNIHSTNQLFPEPNTPPVLPSPGQRSPSLPSETPKIETPPRDTRSQSSLLTQQLSEAASEPLTDKPITPVPESVEKPSPQGIKKKKSISDYVILEEMGQGAYGQVKLARSKLTPSKKVVLKYVTKKRILVDTWTRDRRLGTVPLEIHVLDYLRQDGLRHPNIVEMEGFFEDDTNYYIEMVPHGLPGMDLFDYIELRSNMDEAECRNIFQQVVDAIHHLHTTAKVVHRDIKDENVILDGEGRIKLIDFGSAAYIKNGPFDVFVGTIDYAAPEVLQGKSYLGNAQDIWALGILLYTIVYKENPFYNVDEILEHPLRVPYLPFSEGTIDLIRKMLNRDVEERITITDVLEHPWMREDIASKAEGSSLENASQ